MDVAVTGSSGLIGSALAAALRGDGPSGRPPSSAGRPAPGEIALGPRARDDRRRPGSRARRRGQPGRRGHRGPALDGRAQGAAAALTGGRDDPAGDDAGRPGAPSAGAALGLGHRLLRRPGRRGADRVVGARSTASCPTCAVPGRPPPDRPRTPASASPTSGPAWCWRRRAGCCGRMVPLFRFALGGRLGRGRQYWPLGRARRRGRRHPLAAGPRRPRPASTSPGPARSRTPSSPGPLGAAVHRPTVLPVPPFAPGAPARAGAGAGAAVRLRPGRAPPRSRRPATAFRHPDLESASRSAVGPADERPDHAA